MLTTRPRLLPRPKRHGKGMHPVHRRRRRPSHANGGLREEDEVEEVELRPPGLSILGITAISPLVRCWRRVLSICSVLVCLEPVVVDTAEMKARTRTSWASYSPCLHLDLRFYRHLPLRLQPVPPLPVLYGFFGFFLPLCSVRVSIVRSVVRLYKIYDQFFILNGPSLQVIPLCSHGTRS